MQVNQKFHSYAYSKDNLNFLYLITKLKKKQEEKNRKTKRVYIYYSIFYASDPKMKSLVRTSKNGF